MKKMLDKTNALKAIILSNHLMSYLLRIKHLAVYNDNTLIAVINRLTCKIDTLTADLNSWSVNRFNCGVNIHLRSHYLHICAIHIDNSNISIVTTCAIIGFDVFRTLHFACESVVSGLTKSRCSMKFLTC